MKSGLGILAAAILMTLYSDLSVAQSTLYNKIVEHGKDVSLGFYTSVNPDCTIRGYATVATLGEPQGGSVLSTHMSDFATFVPENPRSVCNKRRLHGTKVWYRANHSFVGVDRFTLQIVRANGDISNYNMQIEVR